MSGKVWMYGSPTLVAAAAAAAAALVVVIVVIVAMVVRKALIHTDTTGNIRFARISLLTELKGSPNYELLHLRFGPTLNYRKPIYFKHGFFITINFFPHYVFLAS